MTRDPSTKKNIKRDRCDVLGDVYDEASCKWAMSSRIAMLFCGQSLIETANPPYIRPIFSSFQDRIRKEEGYVKNCQAVECRHSLDICSLLRELCKRTTCVWHVPNYLFVCQMNSLCCIFMIRYFYLILEEHLCLYDIFVKCHQCFSNQLLSNFVNVYNMSSCLSTIFVFNTNDVTQTKNCHNKVSTSFIL